MEASRQSNEAEASQKEEARGTRKQASVLGRAAAAHAVESVSSSRFEMHLWQSHAQILKRFYEGKQQGNRKMRRRHEPWQELRLPPFSQTICRRDFCAFEPRDSGKGHTFKNHCHSRGKYSGEITSSWPRSRVQRGSARRNKGEMK